MTVPNNRDLQLTSDEQVLFGAGEFKEGRGGKGAAAPDWVHAKAILVFLEKRLVFSVGA